MTVEWALEALKLRTQVDLAAEMGVSAYTVGQWKARGEVPKWAMLSVLAKEDALRLKRVQTFAALLLRELGLER